MKTFARTSASLLLIVTALSAPLGCASIQEKWFAKSQGVLPAESQITLQPLNRPTTNEQGGQPLAFAESSQLVPASHAHFEQLDRSVELGKSYHRLAVLYAKNRDLKHADQNYRQAMPLLSSNPEFLTDYGYYLALQRRDGEAEHVLRKAIQLDPNATRARNNLGLILVATGRRDEAREAFAHAGADETGANMNLKFAARWSKNRSLPTAAGPKQDSIQSMDEASQLAAIEHWPPAMAAPSRPSAGASHRHVGFLEQTDRADRPPTNAARQY